MDNFNFICYEKVPYYVELNLDFKTENIKINQSQQYLYKYKSNSIYKEKLYEISFKNLFNGSEYPPLNYNSLKTNKKNDMYYIT